MLRVRNCRGFTLLEIISVILILGILAAVTIPTFDTSDIEVTTSASTIESDIRYAQDLAMSRNPASAAPIEIIFSSITNQYTITDPEGVFGIITRNLADSNITILSTVTISFNRFGELASSTTAQTVQISEGGATKTITVQPYTGRVTVS